MTKDQLKELHEAHTSLKALMRSTYEIACKGDMTARHHWFELAAIRHKVGTLLAQMTGGPVM